MSRHFASAADNRFLGYLKLVKSTDYTITDADYIVTFTATATCTLPLAADMLTAEPVRIICRAGTLTIARTASDTIKGATSQTLFPGEDLILAAVEAGVWE